MTEVAPQEVLDEELEARIKAALHRHVMRPSKDTWNRLTRLISMRSPQQIARMEKRQGIE